MGFIFFGIRISSILTFPSLVYGLQNNIVEGLWPFGGLCFVFDFSVAFMLTAGFAVDWNFVACFCYVILMNVNSGFKWLKVLNTAWYG